MFSSVILIFHCNRKWKANKMRVCVISVSGDKLPALLRRKTNSASSTADLTMTVLSLVWLLSFPSLALAAR
jgi:hypothetical protein